MAAAEGLRVVDLSRPPTNSLDNLMVSTMLPMIHDWQQVGSDVKLVVIRGNGPPGHAFCIGTNMQLLHACAAAGEARTDSAGTANELHVGRASALNRNILALTHALSSETPPPVVALCDGLTMGTGWSLAHHSTLSIATENTFVALGEPGA